MAAQTALVIVNGTFERIPAADTLVVGAGITGPGDLAVTSADFGVGTGNGHEIDIAGGLGGTTGGHGGKVFLYGGAGQGTGAGGQVNIVGGAAGATGTAGNVLIDSGAPGSALGGVGIGTNANTAAVLLGDVGSNSVLVHANVSGSSTALNGGSFEIFSQRIDFAPRNGATGAASPTNSYIIDVLDSTTSGTAGGGLYIKSGGATGAVAANAGDLVIEGGRPAASGQGGTVILNGGNSTTASGSLPGGVQLNGGAALSGSGQGGGQVSVNGGAADGVGTGGLVAIAAGAAGSTGVGGSVQIYAGQGGTIGGSLDLKGGDGGTAAGGNAHLYGGQGGTGQAGGVLNLNGGAGSNAGAGGQANLIGGTSATGTAGSAVITGGAALGVTGTGGSVTIGGGLGTTTNGIVNLQYAGNSALQVKANAGGDAGTYPRLVEIETGTKFTFAGTAMVNLPSNFQINGTATVFATLGSGQVTATNLNTLTAGPASNADALHTHAVEGMAAVAGQALAVGQVLAFYNAGSAAYAWLASATDAQKHETVGICTTAAAGSASPTTVQTNGEASIPDGFWDTAGGAMVPDATKVGTKVWLSNVNPGNLTTLAPSGSGTWIQKVGVVTKQSTGGFTKVVLLIADSIYLP